MSRSPGSQPVDDSKSSIGAQIGASIQASTPASIQVKKKLAPIRHEPIGPAQKPPLPNEEDDLDESKLPQALEPIEPLASKDLFWPLTGILALLLLTGSFLFFLMISRTPTRELDRRSSPSPSLEVDLSHQGAYIVEYGGMPSPSPSPEPSPSATAVLSLPQASSSPESLELPPLPVASLAPSIRPPVLPPPALPPKISPPKLAATPKPVASAASAFQVMAGPYSSHQEAESGSSELSELGKAVKIREDGGKFWLLIGTPYAQQDEALSLAEQVVQKGQQVTVKKQ